MHLVMGMAMDRAMDMDIYESGKGLCRSGRCTYVRRQVLGKGPDICDSTQYGVPHTAHETHQHTQHKSSKPASLPLPPKCIG
jgi:hypothetical protein